MAAVSVGNLWFCAPDLVFGDTDDEDDASTTYTPISIDSRAEECLNDCRRSRKPRWKERPDTSSIISNSRGPVHWETYSVTKKDNSSQPSVLDPDQHASATPKRLPPKKTEEQSPQAMLVFSSGSKIPRSPLENISTSALMGRTSSPFSTSLIAAPTQFLLGNRRMSGNRDGNNGSPVTVTVNPYQVLQVRRDATPSEIRQAYRRLALWHHPGRAQMQPLRSEERSRRLQVFEILAAAYESLMDKDVRAKCDALLRDEYVDIRVRGQPLQKQMGARNALVARVIGRWVETQQSLQTPATVTMPPRKRSSLSSTVLSPEAPPLEISSSDSTSSSDSVSQFLSSQDTGDSDSVVSDDPPVSHCTRVSSPAFSVGTTLRTSHCSVRTPSTPRIEKPLPGSAASSSGTRSTHRSSRERNRKSPSSASRKKSLQNSFLPSITCTGITAPTSSFDSVPDEATGTEPCRNSSSTTTHGEVHYTQQETNRLFGGPLALLYRARRFRPFRDPMVVFSEVFDSEVELGDVPKDLSQDPTLLVSPRGARSASLLTPNRKSSTLVSSTTDANQATDSRWHNTQRELQPDGSVVLITQRHLHDRCLTRRERFTVDPNTGIPQRAGISVTSEPLRTSESEDADNTEPLKVELEGCSSVWTEWMNVQCSPTSCWSADKDPAVIQSKGSVDQGMNQVWCGWVQPWFSETPEQ